MSFNEEKVREVNQFLQSYMKINNINSLTADKAAQLLADNNILPNNVGPKPAFNFRQMLRDGRDGKIPLVTGAYQERPNTKWIIKNIDKDTTQNLSIQPLNIKSFKSNHSKGKPTIVKSLDEMENPIKGLEPICNEDTQILILGTFPAQESIDENFYYQNQNKRFWGQALQYIEALENISNETRKTILFEKRIGLWDIFEYIERGKGNQDNQIIKAKYNNLEKFLIKHSALRYLVCNGSNSFDWLKEDYPNIFNRDDIKTQKLQSSSGSNSHFNQGEDWAEFFKTST
jgi:hypoxanthine-DNA glycosylase